MAATPKNSKMVEKPLILSEQFTVAMETAPAQKRKIEGLKKRWRRQKISKQYKSGNIQKLKTFRRGYEF